MHDYPHLAQRLFNVPLAIQPDKAEIVMAALADRFGLARLFRADGTQRAFEDDGAVIVVDAPNEREKGYDVLAGVAQIHVSGTLVQKCGSLRPYSGMTGYNGIRVNFLTALADKEVDAIVLDIDSPGGEVAGCFDLADTIFAARGVKPVWAILNEKAFSAAYALASAADRIVVPRTGGTGSIGVVCLHVDFSKALEKSGIAVTLFHYGARKIDGQEFAPLSKEAFDRIQADVDTAGELFVATVARNRGLKPDQVRATEAATFQGARGVTAGLADAVMPPDQAFRALLDSL